MLLFKLHVHHEEYLNPPMCSGAAPVGILPLKIMYTEYRQYAPDVCSMHGIYQLHWSEPNEKIIYFRHVPSIPTTNPLKKTSVRENFEGKK